MGIWIVIIVLGIGTLGSFYMTFLAAKDGDSRGAWLFASFGLLFGIPLFIFGIKAMAKRKAFFKTIDERISGNPEPRTGFVPHWFMMAAIILTVLVIVASILINLIR
jgi:uncharacterized membrane-anchored protein YitT (DUF2179 family)